MEILRIKCDDKAAFDDHYLGEFHEGGLFCPTTKALEVGKDVLIELVSKALPNRVMIKGQVAAWRPALPRLGVRAGAQVQFACDEGSKRDFILASFSGRLDSPKRRHPRIPIDQPVRIRSDQSGQVTARMREISVNRALLADAEPLPLGATLTLSFVPPEAVSPLDISCKVLYHVGSAGMGVKFIFRDGGGARRLRELVRRFMVA